MNCHFDALELTGSDGIYFRSLDEFKVAQCCEVQTWILEPVRIWLTSGTSAKESQIITGVALAWLSEHNVESVHLDIRLRIYRVGEPCKIISYLLTVLGKAISERRESGRSERLATNGRCEKADSIQVHQAKQVLEREPPNKRKGRCRVQACTVLPYKLLVHSTKN